MSEFTIKTCYIHGLKYVNECGLCLLERVRQRPLDPPESYWGSSKWGRVRRKRLKESDN